MVMHLKCIYTRRQAELNLELSSCYLMFKYIVSPSSQRCRLSNFTLTSKIAAAAVKI